MNLYNLNQRYLILANQLIESGGDMSPEQETELSEITTDVTQAGEQISMVIRQMDAESTIIDAEIKRLQAMKNSRENTSERLRLALSEAMSIQGIDRIDTPLVKLSFRKSESVEVDDMEKLPAEYVVSKVVRTPDKIKIKEAIKRGGNIPGASLVINQNLQIK